MKQKDNILRLTLRFDQANEIIYRSLVMIVFGLAYLFAFNLLRFNWYSVFFALLTVILIYFKRKSYLEIDSDCFKIIYFKFYQKRTLNMKQIKQCIFYEEKGRVKIKLNNEETIILYLSEANKAILLKEIIQYYPHISPIHIEKD